MERMDQLFQDFQNPLFQISEFRVILTVDVQCKVDVYFYQTSAFIVALAPKSTNLQIKLQKNCPLVLWHFVPFGFTSVVNRFSAVGTCAWLHHSICCLLFSVPHSSCMSGNVNSQHLLLGNQQRLSV